MRGLRCRHGRENSAWFVLCVAASNVLSLAHRSMIANMSAWVRPTDMQTCPSTWPGNHLKKADSSQYDSVNPCSAPTGS